MAPVRAAADGLSHEPYAQLGFSYYGGVRRVFAGGLRPTKGQPEIPESAAFREWMRARGAALDWDALFDYRRRAPHAVDMHPTDEHLLPWYVAAGAGGRADAPVRLHASVEAGCLGMDAYAFGPHAQRLARHFDAVPAGIAA